MTAKPQTTWLPLKPGDLVDLVAPGYRSSKPELEGAVRFLESWDLRPRVPKNVYGRDLLCATDDRTRLEHLKRALLAEDSSAIWCIRGGYGSNRLIPGLTSLRRPRGRPKLFIGLSDITSLHVFLSQAWGWPTVHGPLLDRLGRKAAKPKYEREMKRFVFGELDEIRFPGLRALNRAARSRGTIRASVTGGNAIVLQSTLGTGAEWDTRGRILFFEDIGERGYRIDRVLEQFRQAGMIDRARAVVFGQFNGGEEADGRNLIVPVLKRFAESVDVPVFSGLPSGHDIVQRPLPFGTRAELTLGARGELVCSTGVAAERERAL